MNLNRFIGIPYQPKGRDFTGLDCWGLCFLFYRQVLDLPAPSYLDQYENPEVYDSVAGAIERNRGNWCAVDQPAYGDVLVFNIFGLPIHTAIYIGGGDFLHAFQKTDSCIERLHSISWQKRLVGTYRWIST